MIPVWAAVGPTGAGKTSWLAALARRAAAAGGTTHALVNDFGPGEEDGHPLERLGLPVTRLPGGGAFCRCQGGALAAWLRGVAAGAGEGGRTAALVEAAGTVDRAALAERLAAAGLDGRLGPWRIAAVFAPWPAARWDRLAPVAARLAAGADLLILNTSGAEDAAALAGARARLARIAEAAGGLPVASAVRGEMDLDPFDAARRPA